MAKSELARITDGALPAAMVWEDDDLLAILDTEPMNIGHVLILTKSEFADIRDVPDSVLAKVLPLARDLGIALCNAFGYAGFNIHQNNGAAAGQEVMHYHLHVWPRRGRDEVRLAFQHEPRYTGNELSDVAGQLSRALREVLDGDPAS